MGYNTDDIPTMEAGAMPQVNIIITCPLPPNKVLSILSDIGIPNGLNDMGYNTDDIPTMVDDIPTMVAGAMLQVNVIITCPLPSFVCHTVVHYTIFSIVWFNSLRCDMYTCTVLVCS